MEISEKELRNIQVAVDSEMREVSDVVDPIVSRLYDRMDDLQRRKGETSEEVQTCGTCKAIKNIKSSEAKKAAQVQDEIIEQIKANPHVFKDVAVVNESTSISDGSSGGDASRVRVVLPEIGTPKWVKELKEMVKGFVGGTRQRSKDYYDPEDLVRGILSKQPEKKIKKQQYIYTVLDTSGSMNASAGGGKSFLQLMTSQIPAIVREYEGEIICCDTQIRYPIYQNKQVRQALSDAGNFAYAGGGGTDFDLAYNYVIRQMEEIRKKSPNAEALVITLTDAGVNWNIDKIKELKNFVVVTSPKERKNVQIITDSLPPEQYPNVRNIFIQ